MNSILLFTSHKFQILDFFPTIQNNKNIFSHGIKFCELAHSSITINTTKYELSVIEENGELYDALDAEKVPETALEKQIFEMERNPKLYTQLIITSKRCTTIEVVENLRNLPECLEYLLSKILNHQKKIISIATMSIKLKYFFNIATFFDKIRNTRVHFTYSKRTLRNLIHRVDWWTKEGKDIGTHYSFDVGSVKEGKYNMKQIKNFFKGRLDKKSSSKTGCVSLEMDNTSRLVIYCEEAQNNWTLNLKVVANE
eukprot:NP_508326.2 F-box C protein [Caenorhabditis elegans]